MKRILIILAIIVWFLSIGLNWADLFYSTEDPELKYMGLFQFERYPLENYKPFDMSHIPADALGRETRKK